MYADYKSNFISCLEAATPEEIREGKEWYDVARLTVRGLAAKYNVSYYKAAAITAVISPRLHWTTNVRYAEQLLAYECNEEHKPAGLMTRSFVMARVVYNSHHYTKHFKHQPKVYAFYQNLAGDDFESVTIDTWIIRAALGEKAAVPKLTDKVRTEMVSALKSAAAQFKLPPAQAQAIIWVYMRNTRRGKR